MPTGNSSRAVIEKQIHQSIDNQYSLMITGSNEEQNEQEKEERLTSSRGYSVCLLYIPSDFIFKVRPPFQKRIT